MDANTQRAGTNYGLVLFLAAVVLWVVEAIALKYSIAQKSPLLCGLTLDASVVLNLALLGASIRVFVARERFAVRPSLWGVIVAGGWAVLKLVSLASAMLS